jgi:hypothetical protein
MKDNEKLFSGRKISEIEKNNDGKFYKVLTKNLSPKS